MIFAEFAQTCRGSIACRRPSFVRPRSVLPAQGRDQWRLSSVSLITSDSCFHSSETSDSYSKMPIQIHYCKVHFQKMHWCTVGSVSVPTGTPSAQNFSTQSVPGPARWQRRGRVLELLSWVELGRFCDMTQWTTRLLAISSHPSANYRAGFTRDITDQAYHLPTG